MKEQAIIEKFNFNRLPNTLLMEIIEFTSESKEFNFLQVSKDFYSRNELWRRFILTDFYQLITASDLVQFSPVIWRKIYSILFRFLKIMTPRTVKELKSPKRIDDIFTEVNSLARKDSHKPHFQNWMLFILGNLLRWQNLAPELSLYYANKFFSAAVKNNSPLLLAWPMLADTAEQIFISLFKNNYGFKELQKQFYKNCYSGALRWIFFVTHDPLMAFALGSLYMIIDEPKKAVYWLKTALNFGLQNQYHQPPTDTYCKIEAWSKLNKLEMKNRSIIFAGPLYEHHKPDNIQIEMTALDNLPDSNILKKNMEFHLKHFDYSWIIGMWPYLQESKLITYQNSEQAIDTWMKQMREITHKKEKHVQAEGILNCLELSPNTSALLNVQLVILPKAKAKAYYKECATILEKTIPTHFELNPYSKNQCRFIGRLPAEIKNISFKGDVDPILEKLNKSGSVQGEEMISWEIVNSTCVKTKESFKLEQVAGLQSQFKGYQISFTAGKKGEQYLLLHNVDASTFEPDPGKEFRFR